jgi:prevent-host-death family protein
MDIGVRALRDNLSKHLTEVKQGHTITVTEHGRVIARIVPAGETVLDRLVAEGRVRPAQRRKGPPPRPVTARGTVSDLVREQRR